MIFSVFLLRKRGARLDKPEQVGDGHLTSARKGISLELQLVSWSGGKQLANPLYDARVVRADIEGMILQGIEQDGDASFVQEWMLKTWDSKGRPY